MNKIIADKTQEIERYVSELEEIKPSTLKEYSSDLKTKAACERYAEKIIEALVDFAFMVIKDRGFKSPESDTEAFKILFDSKVISSSLADKLGDAKGMRNILAHEYGTVNDEILFQAVHEELAKDAMEFIRSVKRLK